MKALLALLMLAALATIAAATPSPFEAKPGKRAPNEDALYLGPVGAMIESDYFGVPRPSLRTTRVFPCRPRLHAIAQEPRFAQICD